MRLVPRSRMQLALCTVAALLSAASAAEDNSTAQSRESLANDQTAAQWTYMLGHQWMDYHDDELSNGQVRPAGVDRLFQARVIMPFAKGDRLPVTLLPRLTLRYSTAQDGTSGLGTGDLFILAIVNDWGSGRWGIGPLITTPASDESLGLTDWTGGLSVGFSQRFLNDRLSVTAVAGQSWGRLDPWLPEDANVEAPLVINPVVIYQVTDEWYISNGDMVLRYDWHEKEWSIPIGVRIGRLFVRPKGTWNVYAEYQTSLLYKDWPSTAIRNQFRLNLSYSIPAG